MSGPDTFSFFLSACDSGPENLKIKIKMTIPSRREGHIRGPCQRWYRSDRHLAEGQQGPGRRSGGQTEDHQQGRALLPGDQQLLPGGLRPVHLQGHRPGGRDRHLLRQLGGSQL